MPSNRTMSSFRIDDDLMAGLRLVRERDGVPVSEQVRRALEMWLESKGVTRKAERKRAVTRKRS